jgi:alpha-ribazole phosphatase
MKLLLVRHGETDWNLARRYQGQNMAPLNQKGIQQAEQLGKRLSSEAIEAVYSSDSPRALQTANYIANLYGPALSVQSDSRWQEICFGEWDGLNYEEVEAKWHNEVTAWYADPVNISPPGGETMLQMSKRVQSALDELKSKHKDEPVLIISHGGVIQVLLCMLLDVELNRYWQFRVAQASLTVIQFYEDAAILDLFNDVSHLKVS